MESREDAAGGHEAADAPSSAGILQYRTFKYFERKHDEAAEICGSAHGTSPVGRMDTVVTYPAWSELDPQLQLDLGRCAELMLQAMLTVLSFIAILPGRKGSVPYQQPVLFLPRWP